MVSVGTLGRYHNFKFELNGIRVWRAYGMGKGKVILYQDIIIKPQGPTDLVVELNSIRLCQGMMTNKAAVSSSALSLDVTWCL